MERRLLLALYSLAHLWVDLSCAFLAFRTMSGTSDFWLCLLLYNFCAFALQMPLGLWADGLDRNGLLAAAGCLLTAGAFLVPIPLAAAVTAGVGNALFHLGGGIDVLNASEKRAAALGVFVSPGAVGLYIGTLWGGGTAVSALLPPVGLLALAGGILLLCRGTKGSLRSGNAPVEVKPAGGGWLALIPLFLVVVLRSWMGLGQSFPWKAEWGVPLVVALALGKAAGGFLMDAIGLRRAAVGSLGLAALLYLFSGDPLPGLLAVFFFNMTMPMTLWAAARILPGAKGFGFGLLTFALFIGYLPVYLGWPEVFANTWACAAAAVVSLALLFRPLGRRELQC